MKWKYEQIKQEQKDLVNKEFSSKSKEELLEEIAELRSILFPLTMPWEAILDNPIDLKETGYITSKLFHTKAENDDNDLFVFWNDDKAKLETKKIPIEKLHSVDYACEESISVRFGNMLHDSFSLIEGHRSGYVYIYYGSITVGDVRKALKKFRKE